MGDSSAGDLLQGLLTMVEAVSGLAVAAAGYRAKCQEAGFSAEAAEEMAVDMHSELLRSAFRAGAPKG